MTEHYFSEKPESELKIFRIGANVLGQELKLLSASGLFSAKELDKGTALLIESAIVKPGTDILDLGCGNGIVGIAMEKAYKAKVIMSDVNERAVMIAKRNIRSLGLKAEAIKSDGFEKINGKFDAILINPPQTAGKRLCNRLILQSKEHLKPNGTLQVVARHNKGGKTLSLFMKQVFGNVRDVAKKAGYRVYLSVNKV